MRHNDLEESKIRIKATLKEFPLPIVRDLIVLGKKSPIGSQAMMRALTFLHNQNFREIILEDEIIGEYLVRESMLLKIPELKLSNYIKKRVKPMMMITDIIQVDLEVETFFEETI